MKYLSFVFFLLTIISCTHKSESGFYGEAFDTVAAVSIQEVMHSMGQQDKQKAVVAGEITTSCQANGCWMKIQDAGGPEVFIDWDEKFHLPKDISGKKAIVSGYAFFDTTSVEALRHLAHDKGASPEEVAAITKPALQLSFKATGVKL